MTVLLILGIVVLALVLVGLIRVGVRVEYAQTGLTLRLLAGPVKLTLYPRKAKRPGPAKAAKAKKPKPPKPARTPGELLALVRGLLPVALEAAGGLRRRIRVDEFCLDVVVGTPDPARTAIQYGRLNGAIGMLWPLAEENLRIVRWRIRTNTDFTAAHTALRLRAAATLTIGQLLALALRTLARALPVLSAAKQPKPGPNTRINTEKEAV